MKKLLAVLMAAAMLMSLCCTAFAEPAEGATYKIAIMTGTTSQGEEEYYAATSLKEKYPNIVLHDTYPDAFSSEVETTISKLIAFASDPDVKAIIFVQAVQGATAAYTQILKDMGREDILLVAGVPAEDPADISAAADIVLANDEIGCGYQVADIANMWECDVIVHYSFARHLSYETIVAKRDAMKTTAESYGIEFVERDCPDPTGDAGMSGAQAAVLEDIPKVMKEYEGVIAVSDTEKAVHDLRKAGIRTAAVFFGSSAHLENVQQIYGKEYVRIRKLNRIADGAAELIRMTLQEMTAQM